MEKINRKFEELCEKPSDINEHLKTLKQYASECEHVTEMGVRWIVSTWAFLAGQPKHLQSYDIAHPKAWGGNLEEVQAAAMEAGIDFEFHQENVLESNIEETDLLFIDTLHRFSQLSQELKLHAEKARKYVILHDTKTFGLTGDDGGEGLKKAINEFLDENVQWKIKEEFTNNNGLTVLSRRTQEEIDKYKASFDAQKRAKEEFRIDDSQPMTIRSQERMKFLITLPDTPYYLWQMLVQITNFRNVGYEQDATYLIDYFNGAPSALLKKIIEYRGFKCKFVLIPDSDRPVEYHPYGATMKPYLVKRFMEQYPNQQNDVFFYTDPDVVFTRRMDLDKYLYGDTWYLSDTRSYLDSDYIKSKGNQLFIELCRIAGVSPRLVERNDVNTGGAQWIIKDGNPEMWKRIMDKSFELWDYMRKTEGFYHPKGHEYPIQTWVGEMLATIWIPWSEGIQTRVSKDLAFGWGNHNIKSWDKFGILHNAGVAKENGRDFCKVTHQNSPFRKNIQVAEDSIGVKYLELIHQTEREFQELIW